MLTDFYVQVVNAAVAVGLLEKYEDQSVDEVAAKMALVEGKPPFGYALKCFMDLLQAKMDADNAGSVCGKKMEVQDGRRYAKVLSIPTVNGTTSSGGSVYAFIDKETGDIFKPASYRAPAKHKRGSIYEQNPVRCCGPHSVDYLR